MVDVKIVRREAATAPTWDTLKTGDWFLDQNGELAVKTGLAGILYPARVTMKRVVLDWRERRALKIFPVDVQIVATERAA